MKDAYIHLSPNSQEYELFCFERYYIVRAYMEKMNMKECIMLDSDVCTYTNYSEHGFQKYDIAASGMYYRDTDKWMIVPHVTYWKLDALRNFTDFLIREYCSHSSRLQDKYQLLVSQKASYGISDMSLLYLWVSEHCHNYYNHAIARNGETFDVFLSSRTNCDGVDFKMHHGIKVVEFRNRIPYFETEDGEKIKANVIHAQGDRKKYIHMLTRYKYNDISLWLAETGFSLIKLSQRGRRYIKRIIAKKLPG